MSTKFRRNAIAAVVAVTVAAVVAGAALADQSYTDPPGDAGSGMDITGATITNTPEGQITIQVATVNPPQASQALYILVDSDRNPSTGESVIPGVLGADYGAFVVAGGIGLFLGWNGSDLVPSIPASFSATGQQFSVNRSDMGNTTSFAFLVLSATANGEEVDIADVMPDSAVPLVYEIVLPQCGNGKDDDGDGKVDTADLGCSGATDNDESDDPVTVKLGKAKTVPAKPKAGKTAVVSAAATRIETGQPLDGGTVKCTAKIVGGGALKGTGSMAAGQATCKFKVPLTAKNKQVRGKIAVTYETATASTPFVFRTAA